LAHALILAKDFAAGQPFAVLLPDDLCVYEKSPILQLKDIFARYGSTVFAIVEEKNSVQWGWDSWGLNRVDKREYLLETQRPEINAESNFFLAGIGRYILPPLFITYSEKALKSAREGELDDGTIFDKMIMNGESVVGYRIHARRFDISTVEGYISALRHYGKRNPLDVYLGPMKR
jgi:UTP--glucose-1-phosphate uridylyltransferase